MIGRGLHIKFILVSCLATLVCLTRIYGQGKVQVVTKTIEKDLDCASEGSLRITAEKGEIEIHGWDKKNMHIKIDLISKNPDRQLAEDELEFLHFGMNHETDLVELTNSFIFPKKHKPITGSLLAKYIIWVPKKYIISIINKFGSIHLFNLQTRTMIDAEYSNMNISNYTGYLSIKSAYSDIAADNLNSELTCVADHAEITLATIGGKYDIENRYGRIDISARKKSGSIVIKASRTPITISVNDLDLYDWNLNTQSSEIHLPDKKYDLYKKTAGTKITFRLKNEKASPVSVSTSYENITIKKISSL